MSANEEEIGEAFIEDLEEERRQNQQAEQAEDLVDAAGNVVDEATETVSDTVEQAQETAQTQQSDSQPDDTTPISEVTTEPADDDSVQTGGSGPEITDAQQQNVDAAVAEDVPSVQQEQQGVESSDDRVGQQAEQLEQRAVEQRDDLGREDVRVVRDGDMLRTELTATGAETLGVNPTDPEQRERARQAIAEQNAGVTQDDLTNVQVSGGQVEADLTDAATTERMAAQNFNRNVRRARLQSLLSTGEETIDTATSTVGSAAAGTEAIADDAGPLLGGLGAVTGTITRDETTADQAEALAQQRRGIENAAAAVQADPTFEPILTEDQAQQRTGQRGAVRAVTASQERGGSERQARGAAAPRRPRDLGDDVVPQEVEGFINRNRRRVQSGVQGALDATGGIQQPTVIPTSDGLQLTGVGTEPTAVERGLGDTTTAPFDAATAATEGTETAAFALEGSPLAGGSQAEQSERVQQVQDEAAFFAERTVAGAEQNPERFGAALAGEVVAGGLAAGALRGGSGASVSSATRQTISSGRRGLTDLRRADSLSEVNARTPSIRVTRDPDAGLIESNLNLGGRARQRLTGERSSESGSLVEDITGRLGDARETAQQSVLFEVDRQIGGVNRAIRSGRQRARGLLGRPDGSGRDAPPGAGLVLSAEAGLRNARRGLADRIAEGTFEATQVGAPDSSGGGLAQRVTPDVDPRGALGRARDRASSAADTATTSALFEADRQVGNLRRSVRAGRRRARERASAAGDGLLDGLRLGDGGDGPPRGAGLLLSAEAGLRNARRGVADRVADGTFQATQVGTPDESARFSGFSLPGTDQPVLAGERLSAGAALRNARQGLSDRVAGGTFEATGVGTPGDGLSILDTTVRIEPGRPPRQSRTLDAELFETGDADGTPVFGFDADGETPAGTIDTDAGSTSDSATTRTIQQADTRRTGTGTDTVRRSADLDLGAGLAGGLAGAQTPTIGTGATSTPGVAGRTDTTEDIGQPQGEQTEPTPSTGLDLGGGLGTGLGLGGRLDLGSAIGPELDFRGETRAPRRQRTPRRRADIRLPGRFAATGLATGQAADSALVQELEQDQRTRTRTRSPGGPRRPRSDGDGEGGRPRRDESGLVIGGAGDAGDGDIAPGFLAETFTGLALFPGEQSAQPASESALEAAAEQGAFEGELPTAELLYPTAEQAGAFETTGDTLGVDL
jgi:hypothetical protein